LAVWEEEYKKTSQRINCGAGKQAQPKFDVLEKNPENGIVFGASKQTKPYKSASQLPSFIRTITVGPGVPPDHVLSLRFDKLSATSVLVGCTTDREFAHTVVQASPCPEGFYSIGKIIPANNRLSKHCDGRLSRPGILCLLDAVDRANRYTLRFIEVTFAFNAGGGVNDVQNAITFADRVGGAFRNASATGDAFFVDFHCHG